MLKILICGDRNWTDWRTIARVIQKISKRWPNATIIHGCARGVDSIAGEWAKKCGLKVEEYPAQWDKYGKVAGPIRNTQMLVEGKPNLGITFHDNIEKSKGTKNMVQQLIRAGVKVKIIKSKS